MVNALQGSAAATPAVGPQLVGRTAELGLLRAFIGRVGATGAALCLDGKPGMGKTALLDAAVMMAADAGMMVLRASGVRPESEISFAALHQLLHPLRARFDDLGPADREVLGRALGFVDEPVPHHRPVAGAVLRLLRLATMDHRILLVADDPGQFDRNTAQVLHFVTSHLTGTRLGMLLSACSTPVLPRPAALDVVELPPLSDHDAGRLLAAAYPVLTGRAFRRVVLESQGNPSALLMLAAVADPAAKQGHRPWRRQLNLLTTQTAGLPPETSALLLLAALRGAASTDPLIARVASGAAGGHLAPAAAAGLISVQESTGRLTFNHPLLRLALLEVSTSDERRRAHRELARLLVDDPENQAWHLAQAGVQADESVARRLEHAAYLARRRGDVHQSVAALLRAADLSAGGVERGRRLAAAAHVSVEISGDFRTVPGLLAAARRADPRLSGSLSAAVAASHLLLNGEGDVDTAHRLLTSALAATDEQYDAGDQFVVEAFQHLSDICFFGARSELWAPLDAALARLRPEVPPLLRLYVQTRRGPVRMTPADLEHLRVALASLSEEHDPSHVRRVAVIAQALDRAAECRGALQRVVEDARTDDPSRFALSAMAVLGFDDVTAGRWNEAEAAANEALRLCTLHGYRIVEWPFWLILMQVAACRGDDKAVAAAVAQLNSWAGPRGVRGVQHYAHRVLALAALGRGDFEDAYRSCREITAPGSLPADLVHAVWISLELVESAMRTNRPVEAAAHARVLQASEVGSVTPRLTMIVAGVAALVAPDEEAFVLFEQALSVPGMARWPWDRARMQLLYGERLRRARAVSRARVQLSAALSTFRGLGAGPWAARAARELEAAGGGHRRPDDPAPSQLTPQEYEVAVLAADGLTNKQIAGRLLISHRTVAAHLRQTFAKLQITTRGALRYELRTARGTGPV